MFSAISQQSQFLLRLLFFLGLHCEFTDTNIIGVDAPQGSNFSKNKLCYSTLLTKFHITPAAKPQKQNQKKLCNRQSMYTKLWSLKT